MHEARLKKLKIHKVQMIVLCFFENSFPFYFMYYLIIGLGFHISHVITTHIKFCF